MPQSKLIRAEFVRKVTELAENSIVCGVPVNDILQSMQDMIDELQYKLINYNGLSLDNIIRR